MSLSRRFFLKHSAAFAVGFSGLHRLVGPLGTGIAPRDGFGPLVEDPQGIFDLPEGFSYRVISRAGDLMSDGYYVPSLPDGMAAFPGPDGLTLLLRNHEVDAGEPAADGPFGERSELLSRVRTDQIYDAGANGEPCLGGVSTVVYDTNRQEVVSQHLSLIGTVRNCAGGPTPWGSWITCEESVLRAGEVAAVDHGYNFEVPATAEPGLVDPVPIKAMGRLNHEAVAVDPETGIVYETEDRPDGLIYRFLPNKPGDLRAGGQLQALAIVGRPSFDTRNWEEITVQPGEILDVDWVDLDNPDAPEDDLRYRGFEAGAACFARGEGMWYGNDSVYFACTNGGQKLSGQVWRYHPDEDGGRLELFVEPNDTRLVENCDNVTVTPWGDLILCEDGPGEHFLVGVTPDGELYRFGRNALSGSEMAGATFSPNGSTLFINIQWDGLTLAITGPWKTA